MEDNPAGREVTLARAIGLARDFISERWLSCILILVAAVAVWQAGDLWRPKPQRDILRPSVPAIEATPPALPISKSDPVPAPLPPAPPAPAGFHYLVRIEGHDIPGDAAYVLRLLSAAGELPLIEARLPANTGACQFFMDTIQFPGKCDGRLRALVGELNQPAETLDQRGAGSQVRVPRDLVFVEEPYYEKYDPENVFDKIKMANDLGRRAAYVREKVETRTGMLRVRYAGYKLALEREKELPSDLIRDLARSRRHVTIARLKTAPAAPALYSSESDEFYNRLCQNVSEGKEYGYAALLGGSDEGLPACGADLTCPNVVLIDTPLYRNDEIAGSMPPAYKPRTDDVAENAMKCLTEVDASKQHGTLLAGIIASARDGRGFAGMHPGALLYPVTWTAGDAEAVAEMLFTRDAGERRRQIYVFAGDWEPEPELFEGWHLANVEFRERPAMARALRDMDGLWIVAAGQKSSARPQLRITKELRLGPMNLGDLPNVLVVTACDACGDNATLWSEANVAKADESMKLVHVAAPGTGIPGIVNNRQYAKGAGTSQATALVAGLASAFLAKYPSAYRQPYALKRRLQYTSTPSFRDADAAGVTSGAINAGLMMKDPAKHWLDLTDPDWVGMKDATILGWCEEAFSMGTMVRGRFDLLQHFPQVRVTDLFRIVKDKRPGPLSRWFAYTKYAWNQGKQFPGEILRVGPAVVSPQDRPALKLAPDRVVGFSEIEDLLVATSQASPLPVVSCARR